jgi:hypothetical protein
VPFQLRAADPFKVVSLLGFYDSSSTLFIVSPAQ